MYFQLDSYSVFYDNGDFRSTELHQILTDNDISQIYLTGLATDYCVYWSALDAHNLGRFTVGYILVGGLDAHNLGMSTIYTGRPWVPIPLVVSLLKGAVTLLRTQLQRCCELWSFGDCM